MRTDLRLFPAAILAVMLMGMILSLPTPSFAAVYSSGTPAQSDNANSAAAGKLDKSQFKDVKVAVDTNGIATLTGTVSLFQYKADAEKRVRKTKGVTAVRNQIEVAGPNVSDSELKAKLAEKLAYDRVGYGNTFNAITIGVQNGAVTLGGHARTDVDKDSALALVSTYPGVKDVNDEIEVDPVSIMPAFNRPVLSSLMTKSWGPKKSSSTLAVAQPFPHFLELTTCLSSPTPQ